jgi:sorting nexin-4
MLIFQLQEAVETAHETSTAFSDEVLKEHSIFEMSKKQEMKELLKTYADGQVEMLQRVSLLDVLHLSFVDDQAMDDWDRIIPMLQRIRVDV